MTDCVAIAPELPFRQQIVELAAHLSRSLPNAFDQSASREFIAGFDSQVALDEGESELDEEKKKGVVKNVVGKFKDLRGGLEGAKESEPESAHLLLHYLLSSTFDPASSEYQDLAKSVVEAVKRGGEAAATAGRMTRTEAACRILNNTYNFFPSSSPLRPTTLLCLLSLLSSSSDLTSLSLSPTFLSAALAHWTIPEAEKISFLTSASSIYQSGGQLDKALEMYVLALSYSVDDKIVDKALVLSISVEDISKLDDVMKVQGVKEAAKGKMGELVALFTDSDELEAVARGQKWLDANASWCEGFGVDQFTPSAILRKLRLIALTTLCARSATKQLGYSEVASTLAIDESEVEAWVIDAIRANLLKARLSQPLAIIRIQSVSSSGTRRFGSEEWALLERRLGEWKKAVADARTVIDEAEALAAQGPITHQRRPQQGQGQGQGQRRQEEEVTA